MLLIKLFFSIYSNMAFSVPFVYEVGEKDGSIRRKGGERADFALVQGNGRGSGSLVPEPNRGWRTRKPMHQLTVGLVHKSRGSPTSRTSPTTIIDDNHV